MNTRPLAVVVVGIVLLVALTAADVDGDGDDGFYITDDSGRTFYFEGAAEHIVLNGAGAALTVADAGAVDKIVAVDRYATYEYTGYEQLADMDAVNLGSFYGTSNHDYIVTTLIGLVEADRLNLDDPILLTSYSSNYELRERLEEIGFTHVLIWTTDSVADYQDIVDFVRDVTMIATGEEGDSYLGMIETIEEIAAAVSAVGDDERVTAIAIWYSSTSGVMVNNKGIASSMLELCNAVNIGYDDSKDSWYGDVNTVISLLAEYPGTVIFLPSSWSTAGYTVEDFREDVLNGSQDYIIIQMGALWNNYCPESADGLMEMAAALYPSLFSSGDGSDDGGTVGEDADGGNGLAWAAAIAIIVLMVTVAYALFRRTHGRRRGMRAAGTSITRTGILAIALVAALVAFALLDLAWAGSYSLSLGQVWDALTGNGTWATDNIVVHQNLPRVIGAVIVGAGLAVTGCTMQAVFKNPLADPYILGLSSGASLGSALAIMFVPTVMLSLAQPVLASLMCLATTFLVYAVSRFGGTAVRTETLVLAGVAISCLFSAIVSFLTYIAPSDKMQSIVFWSLGSLSGLGTEELLIIVPVVAVGIALMLTQGRNLNAMMIGDSHAMDLGVDVRRVRILLLIVSSLMVAACVAFVGTIGFVGLVMPHILRMVLGPDNRLILPMSAVGGGTFLLVCDWASHAVSPLYGVIPIGIITALVGGPFFIYLLCRRNREVGW